MSLSVKHNASEVILSWVKADNGVQLSFKDNGNGVAPNVVDHIFDFGFTTSRRGSGIGLYHVKEIVESMKGNVRVNNQISKGVEFLINFVK